MINRTKEINDYKKANYKRFMMELSKKDYEALKNHTLERNESVNGFIKRAIRETIERDQNKH